MAFTQINCGTSAGNTGLQDCNENFGQFQKIILCDADFEIADEATALLEATWLTGINATKASRIYPLFEHFNAEVDQEERVTEEGWAGITETVREGRDRMTFMFKNIPMYLHKELRKHYGRTNLAVFFVTANGYLVGTTDGTKFLPIRISDFYPGKRSISDGDTKDRTSVFIEIADVKQWNDNPAFIKPTAFDPLLLDGVKDCYLTGTLGVTGATVTVTGAADNVGIIGLVDANWNLYADAAPTVSIAVTSVDNSDGTYTLTWADQTGTGAMTLELADQPSGTSGYESSPDTGGKLTGTL